MPPREPDLSAPRALHVVGVGGAGMSAIASVLARMGHAVTGSDLRESAGLERLRLQGVRCAVGHAAANLPARLDAVVVSTAIPADNAEVTAARARGVPVLRRADALALVARERRAVAVAGSHGKTTTSSMLALVLRAAGRHPSFLIGGEVNDVGSNAAWDDGDLLVVEADESDGTFLRLDPHAAVVTNVEPDHLDHYGGFDALVEAFERFLAGVTGPRVVCADDPVAARLGAAAGARTYGTAPGADYRIVGYEGGRAGCGFHLVAGGAELGAVELPVPGLHNARNAAGATALAIELGAPFEAAVQALRGFGGVARRFQFRGEHGGVTLVDDYAHLPGEVAATLRAAREGEWRRVVAVFQPHRYSRTGALWRDFADAFVDADVVVLTDVYAAGERPVPGVSGRLVLRAVLDAHPATDVAYFPQRSSLAGRVAALARPGDVVVSLGAGDLTALADELLGTGGEPVPDPEVAA